MGTLPAKIGRYKVERLLGEGGMGVLYLARDPVIDRHVALKLLRVNGEDLRRRFMREAQSAGRLQHPNVVTVYDVGDHDGQLFIAMEYIDGDTLATLIRDDVPFSAIRKLDIIDEVADGLGYAHQRGIVHRDIKPANLMITRAGLVKVLDFGIARVSHRESREFDAPTLIGTPAYMAPEQLEGAEVDARSDIYAVGLVMYELFSGCRAFGGSTTADVLQKVLAAQPTPITQLVPGIDRDLAGVIARSMARQPGDRYQDLQAMRKDLARARRRAMQASSDDVTMVVTLPVTRPVTGAATQAQAGVQTPPPAPAMRAIHPPPPSAASPTPAAPARATQTEEDIALEHLAATTQARRDAPALVPSLDETVVAPLKAVAMPPAPSRAPAPPAAAPPMTPPPLPLPSARGNDGPLPVALPPMAPNAGAPPVVGAGRATADSAAIHAARERAAAPSRPPVAAPPPVAANAASAPVPATRAGLPVAVIVVAILGVLAMCLLAAMLVGRALGLVSMSGLFTRTVEPTVTAVLAEQEGTTEGLVVDTTPARQDDSPADTPQEPPRWRRGGGACAGGGDPGADSGGAAARLPCGGGPDAATGDHHRPDGPTARRRPRHAGGGERHAVPPARRASRV